MKKTTCLSFTLSAAILSALLLYAQSAGAAHTQSGATPRYVEGAHYFSLAEAQPVQTGDKIEVLELFWYGCPHCNRLHPFIKSWRTHKPDNAKYVAVPGFLRVSWENHGRARFTFEALGLADELHGKFFDAIHKEGKRMNTPEEVADFAAANGVDRDLFLDTMTSFNVETQMKRARLVPGRYGVSVVPTIIVDGKYRTTVSAAGGHTELLRLIDFLVAKAATER